MLTFFMIIASSHTRACGLARTPTYIYIYMTVLPEYKEFTFNYENEWNFYKTIIKIQN